MPTRVSCRIEDKGLLLERWRQRHHHRYHQLDIARRYIKRVNANNVNVHKFNVFKYRSEGICSSLVDKQFVQEFPSEAYLCVSMSVFVCVRVRVCVFRITFSSPTDFCFIHSRHWIGYLNGMV